MIRTTLISATAIALAAAGSLAQAGQDVPQDPAQAAVPTEAKPKEILDASQVMTRDEAKLFAESEFKQADLDRDGAIDKAEFMAYATIRAPLKTEGAAGEVAAPAEGDAEAAAEAPATAEEQFAEISKDGEEISKTDLAEIRVAQFDAADVNSDERLDTEERMQFAALTAPMAPQNAF